MPYVIIKVNKGYLVMNELTGETYSKKPMTLKKAQAQLSVLLSKYKFNKK
mgnify:CR=1 FL=1